MIPGMPPEFIVPVKFKDYYDVLGVARDADEAAIKKAFRRLAREYHPDVAKNQTGAEAKFKEINEANEVLSDPEKRKKYDELGANWEETERSRAGTPGGFRREGPEGGDFHFEGTGFSDFFEQFFGRRGNPFPEGSHARSNGARGGTFAQNGQDIESDILVTLEEALHGSTRMIRLQRLDPRTGQSVVETLRVQIPAGVRAAQMIRLAGKGQEGVAGGEAGHLYLRVTLGQHPDFRVRGANLYYDVVLAPWEAVLGASVRIPTLDGEANLKIPAGTKAEREFRLSGQGLPMSNGTRGDLHAVVSIETPPSLSAQEKTLWEQLAALSTFNPRKSR
jgi:curved DNA-binding protein